MRVINGWKILGEVVVLRRYYLVECQCGYTGRRRADHVESGRSKYCKACSSKQSLVDHPNPVFGNTVHRGVGDLGRTFWGKIQDGARKRGIEFALSIEYAWSLFTGKCALSGVPISLCSTTKGSNPDYSLFTASLDRIDSSLGYIEGNVQWVHKTVNYIKRDLSDAEFIEWCRRITVINP